MQKDERNFFSQRHHRSHKELSDRIAIQRGSANI